MTKLPAPSPLFTRPSRKTYAALFAAALVAGLSAASAEVPGYYPKPGNPVTGNPDLEFIETKLTGTATLKLVPGTGETIATDKELAAATALAVADEIDGTDVSGVSVQSLVRESSQRLPLKAAVMIASTANAIITEGGLTLAERELYLEQATFEAAAAAPKNAHVVAGNIIKAIVLSPTSQVHADDVAGAAIAANKALAAKVVSSAIAASKKATDQQATAITGASVSTAIAVGATYLIEEITTAAVAATGKLGVAGATHAAATQAVLDAVDAANLDDVSAVVQIAAAAAAGAVATSEPAVADLKAVITAKYGASATTTSANTAIDAYDVVRSGAAESAANNAAIFASSNANEASAVAAGAVAAWTRFAPAIIAEVVNAAHYAGTDDAPEEIITAGTRAYPLSSAKNATAAVDKLETISAYAATAGEIAAMGVIRGTTQEYVGVATSAIIKAFNSLDATSANSIVQAAVNAAESAGHHNTIGVIALSAAKANKTFAVNVAAGAVAAADLATAPAKAAAAVAGAIVADKNNANAITNAAIGARLDDDNEIIEKAADTANAVLANPTGFYNTANSQLASATSTDEALAVVYAATIANPKGASAIAATAVANSNAAAADILTAAQASDFKKSANVEFAVNAAVAAKGADSGSIGDYVGEAVFVNPTFAVDITIGAVASAPQYAHIVGHRAAFSAPTGASKITAALFSFSKIDTVADKPGAAAAIMAGITNGIVEAKLVPAKELASLKASVVAAVKATLLPKPTGMEGPNIPQVVANGAGTTVSSQPSKGAAGVIAGYLSQDYVPGNNGDTAAEVNAATIGAILTVAGKAAKQYVLEMAQAAAHAAAAVSPSFVGNSIVTAFMNVGSTFSQTQIQAAVNQGKSLATNPSTIQLAAGAAGVRNFLHKSGTGDPVTSIFDL